MERDKHIWLGIDLSQMHDKTADVTFTYKDGQIKIKEFLCREIDD